MPDKSLSTLAPSPDALTPGSLLNGPLYAEVKRRITHCLMRGEWPQDSAIPSEARLAQRFAVSSGTVRKALSELVSERVLVRRRGLGTFVASRNRDYMLDAYFRVVDAQGRKRFPDSELLSFGPSRASSQIAAQLRIAPGAAVLSIDNLLLMDARPVILDWIVVPAAVFPGMAEPGFRDRGMTIFGYYQTHFGVTVTRLDERIKAENADARVAAQLRMAPGTAVLSIARVAYTFDGTPVEYRQRWISTEDHAYFNTLGMKAQGGE